MIRDRSASASTTGPGKRLHKRTTALRTESVIYGSVAGISDNGRLYKISVEMTTVESDQATADLFTQMLPTVSFAGQELPSPTLS